MTETSGKNSYSQNVSEQTVFACYQCEKGPCEMNWANKRGLANEL